MGSLPKQLYRGTSAARFWPAVAVWVAAWLLMLVLDGTVDLANLAMVLVLASALAALWLPVAVSLALSALSVLSFNWVFVPPRGTFSVDLRQHALLLGAMLAVSWIIAALMAAQRALAQRARHHAWKADQLRAWGEALRDVDDPLQLAGSLRERLVEAAAAPVHLLLLKEPLRATNDPESALVVGEPDADQLTGLWMCLRESTPFGPGTQRHEELGEWYLPLRGSRASLGAAVIAVPDALRADEEARAHAQSLCNQMGMALQRSQVLRAAVQAQEQAQAQGMRNALLAAISHDYRTPLATIMGAASSLHEQGDRLTHEQRRRLTASILEETGQLSRLTDNTLQLARLDVPKVALQFDWESAEEIVGAALNGVRRRDPQRRVRARLEPGLPLLRCDALLLAQLLDNLIDNALKYSDAPAPVEILVRRQGAHVVLAVRDRGPGVPLPWRERIFDAFQRGAAPVDTNGTQWAESAARRGAGVGLAVCRAVARAHGGELKLRARAHGGCSFECWLPLVEPPPDGVDAEGTA
jgi:two-component system sensor histidine kinase KdpD